MKLHRNYLEEINKLEIIAQLQYDDELITLSQLNNILFTLYDKIENYKKNLQKVNIPQIEIKNYRNVNIIQITESLFCTG